MTRDTMPRLAALASLLVLPATALAANEPWSAPFTIQIGAFHADADTTVRLDSDGGRLGTELSLEGDLGVVKTKTLPDVQFLWRLNSRHGVEAQYISLRRSGTRTLSGSVNWGEATFPVNTSVDTTFDSDVIRVAYRYSPINEGGNELAFLLGAHYTRIKTSLSGQQGVLNDSASVDVPLPTIGIGGGIRIADNLRLTGYAMALKLKIGDYEGELLNASAAVEWAFHRNAFVGLGYNYYKYQLEADKDNARGKFDFQFDGPTLYAGWAF